MDNKYFPLNNLTDAKRYLDRYRYFQEQEYTTRKHVIPFLSTVMKLNAGVSVLEIGCGEGGNLKPFLDMGCRVTGIDIEQVQIDNAGKFYEDHPNRSRLTLIGADIYTVDDPSMKFDLVMTRDVIEHIPDQARFMLFVKNSSTPAADSSRDFRRGSAPSAAISKAATAWCSRERLTSIFCRYPFINQS